MSIATDFGESSTTLLQPPQQTFRRRRVKGYAINTDDESYSSDCGEQPDPVARENIFSVLDDKSLTCVGDEDEEDYPSYPHAFVIHEHSKDVVCFSEMADGELSASNLPLPLYTEKITVPQDLSRGEQFLAAFTMYGELSSARTDDHFDVVFKRLQHEWTFIGGLVRSFMSFVPRQLLIHLFKARRSGCCRYSRIFDLA